ncbi:hypothetical protein A2U01_0005497 [Trifolium medium]|uniref:Uncharacterized protein n=1 Tax=Trifolium medium TaxID=97028 RepID=A0A392MAZ6_9FABA|nr:hypothetical protein [Trifolium medium]
MLWWWWFNERRLPSAPPLFPDVCQLAGAFPTRVAGRQCSFWSLKLRLEFYCSALFSGGWEIQIVVANLLGGIAVVDSLESK